MSTLNLMEKTELWVNGIKLEQVNLTELSAVVAHILGLESHEVMVVDVRFDHITFDLLVREIRQEIIMGKEQEILDALAGVSGVQLTPEACIHSNGILGLICAQTNDADEILRRVDNMRNEITEKVRRRAIVFPTGFELERGMIEDTNSPYIKSVLEENGYTVKVGQVILDDEDVMSECLSEALSCGFGLIITSGGVGAEDKDHSVESVLRVDPDAAVSYIVQYKKGQGRHVKDGVRLSVGTVGISTLVTLPGPHDEVEMVMPALTQMLLKGCDKKTIADCLAGILGEKWRTKKTWHHAHGEHSCKDNI